MQPLSRSHTLIAGSVLQSLNTSCAVSCCVTLQEEFEAAIKNVRSRTVQELTGWKEPLTETDHEGPDAEAHDAADATGNLTAEHSRASAASTDGKQQQQHQGQPGTPGSVTHAKDHQFVTPRTSFSCDPRTKGKGRFQSGSGSVCKDTRSLFGGVSADDVGMTPNSTASDRSHRTRSEGGVHPGNLTPRAASASPAVAATPTPSRTAAEGVEARILAKIASVCTPGPSATTVRKSIAQAAAAAAGATDSHGRPIWQD